MRAVVTRVKNASVEIDGRVNGSIGQGFLVLLGVGPNDTEAQAAKMADKVCGLRVFEDENGKMNRNLEAVGGSLLVVSQFTLYARAAVPASLGPPSPTSPSLSTRSSWPSAKAEGFTWNMANSAPICKCSLRTTAPSLFSLTPTTCECFGAEPRALWRVPSVLAPPKS